MRGKKGCGREAAIQHLPGLSFQAQLGCGANSSGSLQIMSASTVPPMAQPFSILRCCTKLHDLSLICIWKPLLLTVPSGLERKERGPPLRHYQGNMVFAFLREC